MAGYWKSEDDFESDLYALSDVQVTSLPKRAPPPSKYMLKFRGKPSIYDDLEDITDEKPFTECIPVRGYPINETEMKNPGGIPSFVKNETISMIREVSGFGYSNDLIEHMLKGSSLPTTPEKTTKMPNVAFRASTAPQNHFFKVDNKENDYDSSSPKRSPVGRKIHSPMKSPSRQMTYSPSIPEAGVATKPVINIDNRKEFPDLK